MTRENQTTNRRQFLKTLGLAAAALPFAADCASARRSARVSEKPKNVVFILSDDHRYDFMSFLNKPKFLETPNMDRMARNGAYVIVHEHAGTIKAPKNPLRPRGHD